MRQTLAALACVTLFWAVAAAVWPLDGAVVPWDSKNHFYPMLRYLAASLANGELPLWNPYHFSGHPSVADPQSLLFTPTMLLFGWLETTPSMQLFDLVVFAHLLPGAFGIVGLFRRRNWHWLGAVAAALVFILGGSASARLQHTGMIFSYGFFPLALLLLEITLARRSLLYGVLFALTASLMAIGRDQVAFLNCLVLIGVVAQTAFASGRPLAFLRERLVILIPVAVLGAALLAIPSLLTIQFLTDSNRPSFAFQVAALGSLPPSSLATALFADIFGSLRATYDYWGPGPGTLPEGSSTDRAINYLFAGTLPALLILWHGLAGRRLFAKEFRFFLIVGLCALVYALGRYTPIYDLLFHAVPGMDLYRRPADATFLLNVVIALAAGYLVHRYLAEGSPALLRRGRTGTGTAGERPMHRFGARALAALRALAPAGAAVVLVLAALASGYAFAAKAGHLPDALRDVAAGFGMAALIGLVFLAARRKPALRYGLAAALVALTGAELLVRNAGSALNAEPHQRYAVFENLPAEQLKGLQVLKAELDMRHARGERPRVEILGLGGAWQNASMVFGLEDTVGYNPLRIADYARAVGPGENAADPNLRRFPGTFRGYRCQLASLLGLEYLVLDRPLEKMPHRFPQLPHANLIYGTGSMWIYKMPPTMPRAYIASRVVPIDSEAALDEEELPEFDRANTALIEEGDAEDLSGDYGQREPASAGAKAAVADAAEPSPSAGRAIIRGYRRNAIVIDVETDRPAVLVLHDIYYPGWEVLVDGEPRKVLRANLLFRGVEVPAGRHRVRFEFKPLSVDNLVAAATDLMEGGGEENEGEAPETPSPALTMTR